MKEFIKLWFIVAGVVIVAAGIAAIGYLIIETFGIIAGIVYTVTLLTVYFYIMKKSLEKDLKL